MNMSDFNSPSSGSGLAVSTPEQANEFLGELKRILSGTEVIPTLDGLGELDAPKRAGQAGGLLLELYTGKRFTPPEDPGIYVLGAASSRERDFLERYWVQQPKPVEGNPLIIGHQRFYFPEEMEQGRYLLACSSMGRAAKSEREAGFSLVYKPEADKFIAGLKTLDPITPNPGR
jgi:hypothetical protein